LVYDRTDNVWFDTFFAQTGNQGGLVIRGFWWLGFFQKPKRLVAEQRLEFGVVHIVILTGRHTLALVLREC
jgi:hypothetical protein